MYIVLKQVGSADPTEDGRKEGRKEASKQRSKEARKEATKAGGRPDPQPVDSLNRVRNKGWLMEVLKRSVNHRSWLKGFRSFVRIPSTIPTGTSRLDIWIFGYLDYGNQFVAASPIRTSVWCSPAGGFCFQKKTGP